jgi:hypothetical protein
VSQEPLAHKVFLDLPAHKVYKVILEQQELKDLLAHKDLLEQPDQKVTKVYKAYKVYRDQ